MSTPWKCAECGLGNPPEAEACRRCGAEQIFADSVPATATHAPSGAAPFVPTFGYQNTAVAIAHGPESRYQQAYRVARSLEGFGALLKILAFIVGGFLLLIIGVGFINAMQRGGSKAEFEEFVGGAAIAAVFSVVVFAFIYVSGVLLGAVGQILKATLDTAVNTSPFLTTEQKAEILEA